MKQCSYCGKDYPDDLDVCPIDRNILSRVGEPPGSESLTPKVTVRAEFSPEEKRFWERMTFRQFAILMVRLQALWFFVNAATDATYIPRYIIFHSSSYYSSVEIRPELYTLVLRILINLAVGVLIIQKTEKLLSWLVKDCVSEQTIEARK